MEVFAAVHLWALTGRPEFHQVILKQAASVPQLSGPTWNYYEAGAAEALLDYTRLPGADPALCEQIRQQLARSTDSPAFVPGADADLYRAWMEPRAYYWGSCMRRAWYGAVALEAEAYGHMDQARSQLVLQRGADVLHSFHGVNPLSAVELTNMGGLGAERSLKRMYHERWGESAAPPDNPPPGYVVGGPNARYTGRSRSKDGSVEWIRQQPRGKAYAEFGLGSPENSWEITEPAIYYQAMYIRLLSAFTRP